MYRDYDKTVDFSELKGKTLVSVDNEGEQIVFTTIEGEKFRQIYYGDCCASCTVEEVHGDLNDLVGTPILMAEEVSNRDPEPEERARRDKEKEIALANDEYYSDYKYESETWTFYKLATIKGSVTIRWYGSSNGYYSESPTFEKIIEKSVYE